MATGRCTEIRVYLDSGVLVSAWRAVGPYGERALRIVNDPSLTFVASPLLRLETLPKASFHGNVSEVVFLQSFFALVSEWVEVDDALVEEAINLGRRHDVVNLDALHVASALRAGVDLFITTEKPGKPLYRAPGINATYLLDA